MIPSTVDGYVEAVAGHLSGSQRRRREALATLRASLGDLAAELGDEAAACAGFGAPADYAASLADETATGRTFLGMPVSLDAAGIRRRMRESFDPENASWFVPKAYGVGWDLNWGRVAVALGLIRPDDADADVLAAVPATAVRTAAVVAVVPAVAAGVIAVSGLASMEQAPTHWPLRGPADRWGTPAEAFATPLGLAAVSTVLGTLAVRSGRAGARLPALTLATASGLGSLAAASCARWGGRRSSGQVVLAALVGGGIAGAALSSAVVRSGLTRVDALPADGVLPANEEES